MQKWHPCIVKFDKIPQNPKNTLPIKNFKGTKNIKKNSE